MKRTIIFLYDVKSSQIKHYNHNFKKIFDGDLSSNQELDTLIKDGIHALYNTNMGRAFFHTKGEHYIFDVDKMDDGVIIFHGQISDLEDSSLSGVLDPNKLLRLLADNLPDMLWAKDVNGKYIFANKAICENLLMAKDTEEPIGQGDVYFALREREKHKENKEWHTFGELCFNSDEVVLQNMKNMVFEEYGNVKGEHMILEVHKAPFFDDSGRLLGTVGSGRDITKELQAKRELQIKEQLIYQQSKMAMMGEMLENIIHQWKQPLSAISTLSSSGVVHNEIGLPIDNIDHFNKITQHVMHLSETINDFRNFFKEDKEKEPFFLSKIYEHTIELLVQKIKKNSIKMLEEYDEDLEVIGYPRELIQIFMNIFVNAIDEFERKEIEQEIKILKTKILRDGNNGVITIQDNAGGIPENIIDKIFDSKFTTKSETNGTGIGLYMTKEMIEKHMDGTIEVANKEFIHNEKKYRGAEFRITIPLHVND